jgi:hypothetical protein
MANVSVLNTDANLSGKTIAVVENAHTVSGLWTFSRGASAPLAVVSGAALVTNLDADLLDGQHGTYYRDVGNMNAGTLAIARGGTNSATALNSSRIMISTAGAIVEAAALTNGQLLIGSTGAAPAAAALTAGTGITVTNGAGTITVANSGSSVLNRDVEVFVVNGDGEGTTETTVYSFQIDANTLSTNKMLRLRATGDALNNAGAARTIRLRAKYGATTIFDSTALSFGASATRNGWTFDLTLTGRNATNAQAAGGAWAVDSGSGAGSSAGVATTVTGGAGIYAFAAHTAVAEDSTTNLNLVLTVTLGNTDATLDCRVQTVVLELV